MDCPWNSLGQNTEVGSLSLLQGIFPTQGSNPGLLHCWWILYHLSHKGSPRILEGVAYGFSRGIFLTQESNCRLLHCSQILYQLSYQGILVKLKYLNICWLSLIMNLLVFIYHSILLEVCVFLVK